MSTRVSRKPDHVWLVTRIRRKGERIGTFKAPDAETAIEKAAELYHIDDDGKKRLAAVRIGDA